VNAFTSTARTAFHYAFPRISFKLMHMRRVHDEVEMDLLPILVDEHKEAVDVGANVGRYAKPLSALATHVHAFEPHPRLARVLSRSLPRNVTVNQTAVSSTFGRVVLHIPIVHGRQDEGIAHISSPSEDERCDKIEVACVPLDTLARRGTFAEVIAPNRACRG
jgi:FkbM family methyltransferase